MDGFEQPGRQIPWKPIAIIAGGAVVIVIVGIVVWQFTARRQDARLEEATVNQVSQELENQLGTCDASENPDGCRQQLVEDTATSIGAVQICEKLTGELYDNCVWSVAAESMDPDDCATISNEAQRVSCYDSGYRSLAERDYDGVWCDKIKSQIAKDRCFEAIGPGPSEGFAQAVASEDPALCAVLMDEGERVTCQDIVGSGDRDHDDLSADLEANIGTSDASTDSDTDGLSDADEYHEWGTDPANHDTDGDGFLDGVEAEGGYDPLGPGVL